jgi:hypothetical protein
MSFLELGRSMSGEAEVLRHFADGGILGAGAGVAVNESSADGPGVDRRGCNDPLGQFGRNDVQVSAGGVRGSLLLMSCGRFAPLKGCLWRATQRA